MGKKALIGFDQWDNFELKVEIDIDRYYSKTVK